ncbi:MAG: alpha-L-fucosidase [Phycisphaeraceae bacterium]|nr:alpha-L-fucosidase [Phycisphaeraceae bacterium]
MSHTAKDWLSASRFNLLVDYYPEVSFRPYGSGIDEAQAVDMLRRLDLGYICVYAKGHGGYTTFRSSLHTEHLMLAQDMPALFRHATRKTGTKLVLYYSGLLDGVAAIRHPDWTMLNDQGEKYAYFPDFPHMKAMGVCPHSDYFDQWVSVHLAEMFSRYEPDGIWVDGDWPGPCHCPRCLAKFSERTGWTGTLSDLRQREGFARQYSSFWIGVLATWRQRFRALVQSLKSDCAYSAGNVSARRQFAGAFDWRSGDFFSPGMFRLNDIARMMRWYATLDTPYDAYVCDTKFTHFKPKTRSRTKTVQRMMQEAATVGASGGAVGYWTYPLGNGAMIPSRVAIAEQVRHFVRQREPVWRDVKIVPWTLIVAAETHGSALGSAALAGAHMAMAALHRSPRISDESILTQPVPDRLIVLPESPKLDDATVDALEAHLRRGGSVLASGPELLHSPRYRQLLGVGDASFGKVHDGFVLTRATREPVGIDGDWNQLELREAKELYPLLLPWDDHNPEAAGMTNSWPMHGQLDETQPESAGFAAAVIRECGPGRIIHVNTSLFTRYVHLGDVAMLRWMRELVDELDDQPLLTTDAPSWVDMTVQRQGDRLLIQVVNTNPGRDLSLLGGEDHWVDEIPEVGPYEARVRMPEKPRRVTWEPAGTVLAFTYDQGVARIEIPRVHIHGCVVVA